MYILKNLHFPEGLKFLILQVHMTAFLLLILIGIIQFDVEISIQKIR